MNIIYYPNEVLAEPAYPVSEDYPEGELRQIIGDMKLMMYKHKGVGLAAPQVGLPMMIFVMDPQEKTKGKDFTFFINPEYLIPSQLDTTPASLSSSSRPETIPFPTSHREGCLSAPGFSTLVDRVNFITLAWEDINRVKHQDSFTGKKAQIIQHEMDHLNGKCIVDKAPREQRIHYLSLFK